MLSPEDVDLVAQLKKVADLIPGVAFDLLTEILPPEREHEFGQILIHSGEILCRRAEERSNPEAPIRVSDAKRLASRLETLP